ncbi:PPC domain-containing protein [Brevundimonas bacteroides]|uniref:PPC domain-containing protein n=1 Tax=Brevundimonas bacteroides TaxID=74311 RepID=UPI000495DD37|nr:PPC domain-containing protein [Brevundimonas bacteroides]
MRRSTIIATVSAIALFASAGSALAQDPTPLRLDQDVSGALTDDDARVDDPDMGQYVYDLYAIDARAGQRLEITMRSDAFDSYLELTRAGSNEVLASDDDGLGEGLHSRLRYTVVEGGTYVLRARTLGGLEGGDYALKMIDRGPAPPAPRPTAIRLGSTIDGDISDNDPEHEGEDQYSNYLYDAYSFTAREGERIAVTLRSEAFDPIVRVGGMALSGRWEELAANDDRPGGGDLNSYLVFTAPADGEYLIRAAPLGGSQTGPYTVGIAEGPPPMSTRSIGFGDTIEGALSDDDGQNDSGVIADGYTFEGRAGQRVVVTMSSDDFDTWLDLYAGEGGGRYVVDSDDDGAGEGTNSRLTYTLAEDGLYSIEARGFSEDGRGDYELTLTEAAPEPEPTPLAYGRTIEGEINAGDPRDDDNRGFDAFRISGQEGNRIQLIMRSGDFDTYLQIGSPEGDFYALASDDDGLGEGTDSRLNYILPSTGDFIVRAGPLFSDADGLYSLELVDRGPQPAPGSIIVGATARGSLGEDDAIAEDGSFYDAYRISVKAGDKLRLTMVSNEFDTYLDIGRGEGAEWMSVASDDDGLSDTHAKVDWSVEEDGEYIIRARSFASGQTGAYALNIEPRE